MQFIIWCQVSIITTWSIYFGHCVVSIFIDLLSNIRLLSRYVVFMLILVASLRLEGHNLGYILANNKAFTINVYVPLFYK